MKRTNALKSVAVVLAVVAVVGAFSVFLPSNGNADTNKDTSNKIDSPETEACAHLSLGEWKSISNYHIRKCSSCTFSESEPHSYVESVCSVCGAEEPQEGVEEHECQFDYLIQMNLVVSTCQVKGSCEYPCTIKGCTKTDKKFFELLEHNYGDWKTVTEATCTEKGRESRICSYSECQHVDYRDIPILSHDGDYELYGRCNICGEENPDWECPSQSFL